MGALNLKLNSFSAVGAGQTANLVLENGPYYQDIYLKYSGSASEIESVKLKLNTVSLFELSGTQLNMLADYYGYHRELNYFALPLSCIQSNELKRRLQTGIATFAGDNLVLEVKIAATATNPELEAFAEVRPNPGIRPVVRRFMPYTIPANGAGVCQFTSFDKNQTGQSPRIVAAHFFKDGNDINSLEIKRDKTVLHEMEKAHNDFILKREGRTPQAKYYHFDPTRVDYPVEEAMATASQSLEFKFDVGSAGNILGLIEVLDPDPRLIRSESAVVAAGKPSGGKKRGRMGRR